jgi:hypothetical protein
MENPGDFDVFASTPLSTFSRTLRIINCKASAWIKN